ncbi:MAG TPA: ATP-binding protein, partial [Reyranella sp.]|nr:ATP-binding protein [Reyranella sp.]
RPAPVDVAKLVHRFSDLLQQAVGEAVTLTVDAPEAAWTNVDPTQLETAILNLAVNARDAMPAGGELKLQVRSEVRADVSRVIIEVVDSGVGMEPEVAEKVFEPFFTTKEVGKGSGLGLSQVYGFVRQSGGHVEVDTAPGKGTSFRLYLPTGEAGPSLVEQEVHTVVTGGSEHVLVVEDDQTVLSVALETLTALGYRVTTASSAAEALQAFREDASIDLVFTDVVMPGGSSGVDLAHQIRDLRPDVGVLLTSGYIGHRTAPTGAFALIDKPYEPSILAARVREVLGGRSKPRPRTRSRRAVQATG